MPSPILRCSQQQARFWVGDVFSETVFADAAAIDLNTCS